MIIVTVGGNPTPVWTALRFHLDVELRPCVLVHTAETRAVAERLHGALRARPGCRDLAHQLVHIDPLATGADLGALDGLPLPLGLDAAVDVSGGTKLMAARVTGWAQARGLRDDLLTTVPEPGRIGRPFQGEGFEYSVNSTVEEMVSLHCDGPFATSGLPAALKDDELRRRAVAYFAQRISTWTPRPGGAAEPESYPDLPTIAYRGPDEDHWNGAFQARAKRSNPDRTRWFELALLLALAQEDNHSCYHDLRTDIKIGPNDKPRLQADVVGMRAGQLWEFSATTSPLGDNSGLTVRGWEKVTEAVVRARHLGGEDAQPVVVTVQPEAQLIRCPRRGRADLSRSASTDPGRGRPSGRCTATRRSAAAGPPGDAAFAHTPAAGATAGGAVHGSGGRCRRQRHARRRCHRGP